MKTSNLVRAFVFARVAFLLDSRAFGAANVYYVPTDGAVLTNDWSVVENWYTNTGGTTPLGALPGANETVMLTTAALNGKTLVIPAGTAANLYAFQVGNADASVKLTGGDGASLSAGHSAYVGNRGSDNEIRIAYRSRERWYGMFTTRQGRAKTPASPQTQRGACRGATGK